MTDGLRVAEDDLDSHFAGVDAVIHLAWLFQPTHDSVATWRNNVLGAMNVFRAVARNRVPALIYSSSVGAYSPGPDGTPVTESWPTPGWPGAACWCRTSAACGSRRCTPRTSPTRSASPR